MDALVRLEGKIDKLAEAFVVLARIDERQVAATKDTGELTVRVSTLEGAHTKTNQTLHAWINRGVGAWAIFGGIATGVGIWKVFA